MRRLAAIGAAKLSFYLKQKYSEEFLKEKLNAYSTMLDPNIDEDKLESIIASLVFNKEDEKDINLMSIYYLGGEDNAISRTLVELGCLRYLYPDTDELFELVASGNEDGITIETVARIVSLSDVINDFYDSLLETYFLYKNFMVPQEEKDDYIRTPLKVDGRLASYFAGVDVLDKDLFDDCKLRYIVDEPAVYGYKDKVDSLLNQLNDFKVAVKNDEVSDRENLVVVISGEEGSGRLNTVHYLISKLLVPLIEVDYEFLIKVEKPKFIIRKIVRESCLLQGCICIKNVQNTEELNYVLSKFIDQYHKSSTRPLFITCNGDVKLRPVLDSNVLCFDIKKCNGTESFEIWNGLLKHVPDYEKIDIRKISSKMTLTPGQIKKIADEIYAISIAENRIPDEHEIYRMCYQVLDDGRYDSIKRVESKYTFDDLMISESNINILKDITAQVENRQRVFEDWGMNKKYAYGRCISVIFAGPPGTGKTMAVHALANELGLELYKVDLSQITDKYVGETEKRLEEVFKKAEKSNMILFFDEADAVMGKRSETKDAHDKYANTQIAFILQRIEEYDGIVILATNYMQNIDQAFMRRIKYVVNIGIPDEKIRKAIWKNSFAEGVPMSKDIDFDYLASEFEIAGGDIKNIVLNATFNAASEDVPVNMYHIMKAVVRENSKDKKGIITENYGKYSYLVKDLKS